MTLPGIQYAVGEVRSKPWVRPCDHDTVMSIEDYAQDARIVLSGLGWSALEAVQHVGHVPGLYSIHAAPHAWGVLGLNHRPGAALYVGKSESSLARRELHQHFSTNPALQARTGSSTVRRSFAALLHERLNLRAVPRNKAKPERFANFGLEPDGDRLLTRWMNEHLTVAIWAAPKGLPIATLKAIEVHIIRAWTPPLNITDNPGRLEYLREARARLANEARAWSPSKAASG